MKALLALVKRNCLCFLRDRTNVIFSFMAALIVVMLYMFVLRDMMISSYPHLKNVENLVDSWVLAGIAGITGVTSSMGALQIMNTDRHEGRDADFEVTPAGEWRMAFGYILSAFATAFIFSVAILVLSFIFLAATGCPLSPVNMLLAVLLAIPSALSGCAIMYALTSFIKSPGGYSGFYTIVSVAIGFLTGIYIPMGQMPDAMQVFGSVIPATHISSIFRQLISGEALDVSFAGADATQFRLDMGFDLKIGGFAFDALSSLLYVIGVSVALLVVSIFIAKKR